jgi:hypothetical protein
VGDLLLLCVGYGGGTPVLGASGITGGGAGSWTELSGFPQGGTSTATGITIAQKVAASGDSGATYTVNFQQTTQKAVMVVVVCHDTGGTPTVGASAGRGNIAAATALTTSAITVAAGSQIMAVFTQRDSSVTNTFTAGTWTGTATGLTGTERVDACNTGSSEVSAEWQDGNAAVAAGGTVTAASTALTSLAYSAGIVEVVPAAGAPPWQAPRPPKPSFVPLARAAYW